MKINDITLNSIEEFDDYIQALDLDQLKQIENNSEILLSNQPQYIAYDDDEFAEIDSYIQSLQLA